MGEINGNLQGYLDTAYHIFFKDQEGAFAGLGLVYVNGLNKDGWYPLNSIYVDGHIGGSLNIDNTHKLEVGLGSGLSLISFRYTYMF